MQETKQETKIIAPETKLDGKNLVSAAMGRATIKGTAAGLRQNDVATILNSLRPQISQAIPKHLTTDRMIQMASTLIVRDPNIAKCSIPSLVGAVMQSSILGFEPVAALQQVYFVPRQNKRKVDGKEVYVWEVEFTLGYKGMIQLAQNSGQIKELYAMVVRQGDKYKETHGLHRDLIHEPHPERTGREKITHAYAVAHFINGGMHFEPLTFNEIEDHRMRSPAQKKYGLSGVWAEHYAQMAKKTAIRQLFTYLPKSIQMQAAMESDGRVIDLKAFSNDNSGINLDALAPPTEEVLDEEPAAPNTENEEGV